MASSKTWLSAVFQGGIYPVNPNRRGDFRCVSVSHVKDVPDPVDLAMIVLPVEMTLTTLQECADRGIRNAVIITCGFKEVGGAGAALESQVLSFARETVCVSLPQLCGRDEHVQWLECHFYQRLAWKRPNCLYFSVWRDFGGVVDLIYRIKNWFLTLREPWQRDGCL
jgi:acetyltransferase